MRVSFIILIFVSPYCWAMSFNDWLVNQKKVAEQQILANTSPQGAVKGTVLASTSKTDPDYYFHWVRDASLTMMAIQDFRIGNTDVLLNDFLTLTQLHQSKSGDLNLGEPKYLVSSEPFTGPWGRPQNDGPALRAIVFANWANYLLNSKNESYVRLNIYDGSFLSKSVLKRDLEYIAHHWSEPSYDLWEEVKGEHFYTLMVIRKALLLGADVALRLSDPAAAKFYFEQADLIKIKLQSFVVNNKLVATQNYVAGLSTKSSNKDVAVLLGVLHGDLDNGFLSSQVVSQTLKDLQSTFKAIYNVNSHGPSAAAFGRYPEDTYYGGNPWFLTTLAQAEIMYKSASTQYDIDQADLVMKRVQYHVPADLHLTEQLDKNSGFCLGAADLTWSYVSFLTAAHAREAALLSLVGLHTQKDTKIPRD